MTLAELNDADLIGFVARLDGVFEDAPWVAERAWRRRPFASVDDLHAAMVAEMMSADHQEQVALLQAHPDLGARAPMSEASVSEQTGAGLDRLTPTEHARLLRLNRAYRDRFGFPFLLAVTGATKGDVLAALEQRLGSTAEAEWLEALAQVARIARFRLDARLPEGPGASALP
jgi:2-oxo-4-hydroxy-4-carboxy-5-ureidoimidazoline decarboxylase